MANELAVYYPTPSLSTIYFVVGQDPNKLYNTSGTPAFETTNLAHWTSYAIAAADAGGFGDYRATFPAGISVGQVNVFAYLKVGGSAASTDTLIGIGIGQLWNGSAVVSPSDVVSSGGKELLPDNGGIVSATSTTVVLDPTDPLLPSNLQGYRIEFTNKGRYGIITDPSTTASRQVARWSDGVTPTAGDRYYLSAPEVLAPAGLDQISVENGVNARQALVLAGAAMAGALSGAGSGPIVIKGAGTNTTRISAITDQNGNRTSVTLTLP